MTSTGSHESQLWILTPLLSLMTKLVAALSEVEVYDVIQFLCNDCCSKEFPGQNLLLDPLVQEKSPRGNLLRGRTACHLWQFELLNHPSSAWWHYYHCYPHPGQQNCTCQKLIKRTKQQKRTMETRQNRHFLNNTTTNARFTAIQVWFRLTEQTEQEHQKSISEEYRRQEKKQDREGDSLIGRQRGSMKKFRFLDMSTMILKAGEQDKLRGWKRGPIIPSNG